MKRTVKSLSETITAILLISAVISVSAFLSLEVKSSALYRQSRVLSMLIRQEPAGIAGVLKDTRNIDMAVKFAGALTTAYINFELIPLGEAATFAAVFESIPEGVDIESFEYRRKDLYITVSAGDADYLAFISGLRDQEHFSSVTGKRLVSGDGKAMYEIVCVPDIPEAGIDILDYKLIPGAEG